MHIFKWNSCDTYWNEVEIVFSQMNEILKILMLLMIAASTMTQDASQSDGIAVNHSEPQDTAQQSDLASAINKQHPSRLEPCFPLCFPDYGKREYLVGERAEKDLLNTNKRSLFKQVKGFIPQFIWKAFKREQALEAIKKSGSH